MRARAPLLPAFDLIFFGAFSAERDKRRMADVNSCGEFVFFFSPLCFRRIDFVLFIYFIFVVVVVVVVVLFWVFILGASLSFSARFAILYRHKTHKKKKNLPADSNSAPSNLTN